MKREYFIVVLIFGIVLISGCSTSHVKEQTLSDCDNLGDTGVKISCYKGIAIAKQDTSICDKIQDINSRGTSYERGVCYDAIAIAKGDISICDKNPERKSNCYWDFGIAKQDISICDKITEDGKKWHCYGGVAKLTQDNSIYDKCDSLEEDNKNNCYITIAGERGDLSVCETFEDEYLKSFCFWYVSLKTDKNALENESLCEKIKDEFEKAYCYTDAAVAKQNLTICDEIDVYADNQGERDNCYRNIGIAKQDPSICEKIEELWQRYNCYWPIVCENMIIMEDDCHFTVCEKIENNIVRNDCYFTVAVSKQELSICNEIENQKYKEECIDKIKEI